MPFQYGIISLGYMRGPTAGLTCHCGSEFEYVRSALP